MTTKVLLATTVCWPSAGRLAGAFSAAGCRVTCLLPSHHPAARSRYFERAFVYRPLSDIGSLLEAIRLARSDFIVPLDDRATGLLLRARRCASNGVAALIEYSLGRPESYNLMMSRSGFIEAARQDGIRTPPTRAIANDGDLEIAFAEIGFPAVLKADSTWGGVGVAVAGERDAGLKAYHRLADPPSRLRNVARAIRYSDAHLLRAALAPVRPAISLQHFVPGRPATTSFACWQGKLLVANHFEMLEAREADGPASVLRRLESSEMQEAAARLAARFGLSGLHGLDFIRCEDGKTYLIEINPRSPQTSHLSFGAEHDLVFALAEQLDGTARAPRPRVAGDVVALFPQEWMRDPASPYLTNAFHDVPWDDPAMMGAWMESREAQPTLEKWRTFMAQGPQGPRLAT